MGSPPARRVKYHPATYMLGVWLAAVAVLLALPLDITGRPLSLYGYVILALFILVFVAGSFLGGRPAPQQPRRRDLVLDFHLTDRILKFASLVALAAFALELTRRDFLDLGASYVERDSRAGGLIYGTESEASIAFQIGFLFYPAAITYLTRVIGFDRRVNLPQTLLYGVAPTVAASLALGGRSPLLYAVIMAALSLGIRREYLGSRSVPQIKRSSLAIYSVGILGALLSFNYFSQVFLARAEVTGGIDASFDNAALSWGVSLRPDWYSFLVGTVGQGATFLILQFSWYAVQGIVISNQIFSEYSGNMALGAYGVDLGAAIARRIDPQFATTRFLELLDINVYGFLPTAFGSLYVDFAWFGLIFTGIWGYACGLVYNHVNQGADSRWLIYVPFVIFGILFSLINTPLGFANGLMVYVWLFISMRYCQICPGGTLMHK